MTGVRRATVHDVDRVVEVLVASHLDDAWERWALPFDDRREASHGSTGATSARSRSVPARSG